MTLDLAIATHGKEGILKVEKMLLPPQKGVRYIVSWQEHAETPIPLSILQRRDVEVWRLDKTGVSNNRNNAMSHCQGDIVLASDDDLIYDKDAFGKILKTFEIYSDLDLATFRVRFQKEKPYPPGGTPLTLPFPKNYWVSCVEIAFRRKRLQNVSFNPKIGPGAPELLCGEDELFVIDAIKAGLNCRHIGEVICSHPHPSTGNRVSEGILKSNGYLIKNIYPTTYLLRIILKAYRLSREGKVGMTVAMRNMLRGVRIKI